MKTNLNYNRRRVPVLLLVGLFAASCSKDPVSDIPGGGPEGTGKTITAAFDLTRDFEQSVEVRADGSEDVTTIKDLWVIQIAPDGSELLQEPLYFKELIPIDDDYRVEFNVQETPCKMVFVANTHDANAYAGLELTSTEADVAAVARKITDETDLTANGVPMCGTWSGTPVAAVPGKVWMSRAVARVTFNLGASLPAGDSFEVLNIQVKHVPSTMSYYRAEATLSDYPYPALTSAETFDYPMELPENLQFAGGYLPNNQEYMWYLPENARGVGTASDQFRKTAETAPAGQADYCTCIEVYGRYFDASEPAGEQTFITTYRLFLGENNKTDYNLLRNHTYTVNTTLRGRNEMDTSIDCAPNPTDRIEITPMVNVSYGVTPSVGVQSAGKAQSGSGIESAGIYPGTKAPADGSTVLDMYFARADAPSGAYGAYGTTALKASRAAGTGAVALTFSPVQYYLPNGKKTKMVGWYPQANSFTGGVVSWTFDGTQDIMTSAVSQEGSTTVPMPAFTFNHKTAQLQFFLYAEDTKAQTVWGKVESIAVTAQRNTCTFTVSSAESTGQVTFTGDADKTFTVAGASGVLPVVGRNNALQFGQAMMIEPQDEGYQLHITVKTAMKGTVTTIVSAQAYPVGSVTRLMLKFPNGDVTVEPEILVNGWTESNQEVEMG